MSITDFLDRLAEPKNLRFIAVVFCVLVVVAVALGALATAISFQSAANARGAAADAKRAIERVEAGRRVGSAITCATTSAIIDAGRDTIRASAYVRPKEFAIALESLGLPPFTTRAEYANAAAQAYARKISVAVGKTGVRGVVREDGTLDCVALQKAAKIEAVP